MNKNIHKGDIYMVDFGTTGVVGSEQAGIRPAVIIQNDKGNMYSPTTIVVPITSKQTKKPLPTHVPVKKNYFYKIPNATDSVVLAEVIRTVSKERIISEKLSRLTVEDMNKLEKAIKCSLDIF